MNDEEPYYSSFVIWTSSLVSNIPERPGRRGAPPRRSVLKTPPRSPADAADPVAAIVDGLLLLPKEGRVCDRFPQTRRKRRSPTQWFVNEPPFSSGLLTLRVK